MVAPMLASKKIPLRPLSSTRLPSMRAPALGWCRTRCRRGGCDGRNCCGTSRSPTAPPFVPDRYRRSRCSRRSCYRPETLGSRHRARRDSTTRHDAHVVVDVIVPDGEIGRKFDADFGIGNLVVFDRPMIGHPVVGMDATLGHVADHEIPNGHGVDVFVVRPERGLRVIARRSSRCRRGSRRTRRQTYSRLRPDRTRSANACRLADRTWCYPH